LSPSLIADPPPIQFVGRDYPSHSGPTTVCLLFFLLVFGSV
jgi:hypothetical protein